MWVVVGVGLLLGCWAARGWVVRKPGKQGTQDGEVHPQAVCVKVCVCRGRLNGQRHPPPLK